MPKQKTEQLIAAPSVKPLHCKKEGERGRTTAVVATVVVVLFQFAMQDDCSVLERMLVLISHWLSFVK